ncbi:hypothetical protein OEZ86_013925 [Tetradesmus obliquus]|nr:hypothetical protein OEZ86_013925 [Tetradesmus obliquus]
MDRQAASPAAAAAGPEELKQQIYSQLKKAGVVSSLKSQLRMQLLDQLRKLAGPDAVRAAGTGTDQTRSMWHAALNCMLAEYLQASNCQFTLSVFNSETDTAPGQPAYSTEELCQLLRLDRQPQLLQRVQELLPSHGCLVLALLQALASSGGGPTTADSSCQTSRPGQLDGLKGRLLQLEDAYMAKAAQKATADPRLTLDQQMSAYKKECDELVELQVAARVARIREVELAAARQEAAAKYRQQLEADRQELERIHSERLARLAAREEAVGEKLRRQQRDVEGIAYSQRQRILAEEDRLRGMKAEVGRQLEVQEQLLHGLEAQLKERERAVSARELAAETKLAEVAELESKLAAAARKDAAAALAEEQAALRGERTALESERARVSELRSAVNADLAVARAHEDRLRTLEAARAEAEARSAAHAAGEEVLRMQLKALQAEAAALQQELVRTGAAAGAAAAAAGGMDAQQQFGYVLGGRPLGGIGGGGGAPLQLPQALRELGQWQRRAQQAELLAEEAAVERDAAQSRADELSLDLNAARRERLAEFRRRSAAQRAVAARQLADLRAANSGGGADPAAAASRPGGSSGGGAAGLQGQCRLSIPSEFDGFGGSQVEEAAGGLSLIFGM